MQAIQQSFDLVERIQSLSAETNTGSGEGDIYNAASSIVEQAENLLRFIQRVHEAEDN
jgi:hypothetical protein